MSRLICLRCLCVSSIISVPTGRVIFEIGGVPIREELARDSKIEIVKKLDLYSYIFLQFYVKPLQSFLRKWNLLTSQHLHDLETSSYNLNQYWSLPQCQNLSEHLVSKVLQFLDQTRLFICLVVPFSHNISFMLDCCDVSMIQQLQLLKLHFIRVFP